MIKQIAKSSKTVSPFIAVKEWELYNTANSDVVLVEPPGGEPEYAVALDYVDYSGNPLLNRECNIALEQQEDDVAIYQEGVSGSGFFDPSIDEKNADGTFKRLVYDQTEKAFYNQYRNPLEIFGMENIDFPLSRTVRNMGDRFLLFTIPQLIMGDKLVPGTVQMYDTSLDDNVNIYDDSLGNLVAGNNLFSKVQEVRLLGNSLYNGQINNQCVTFSLAPIGTPTISASQTSNPLYTPNLSASQTQGATTTTTTTTTTPPPAMLCNPSPIPTGDITGSITNSSPTSSYRPGYYASSIPYYATSGSVLNVFMYGYGFTEYLSLIDPSGSVVSQSFGVTNFGAVIQSALSMDGLYTIEASTNSPGATGTYRLRVSSGPTMHLELSSSYPKNFWYIASIAYATSSQLLFLADQDSALVTVVNPLSNSLVSYLDFSGIGYGVDDIVYGYGQDKIYATVYGPITKSIQVINSDATVGPAIDTLIHSSEYDFDLDYDYVNDRIVVVGDVNNEPNFSIMDCSTNTIIHTDHLAGIPVSVAYVGSNNTYYVTLQSSNTIYKIDANTFAVTTSPFNGGSNSSIVYIKEVNKLIVYGGSTVVFLDPSTDTLTADTYLQEFEHAVFDPCSNTIRMVNYFSGMFEFETSSFALVNRWPIVSINGFSLNEGPAYSNVNSMTYTMDRLNNVLYATPMDSGQYLIPPAPPTSSNIPYIVDYLTVLSQFDSGSGGTCDPSTDPEWNGVFDLNTVWNGTYPLYYFINQSILGATVASNYCPNYPSNNWQNTDCSTQVYWNGSNWDLWISCVNCGYIWNGTSDTSDINNPAGTYTVTGPGSMNPSTIVISISGSYPAPSLVIIPDQETPSAVMTNGNLSIRFLNGNYFGTSYNNTDTLYVSSNGQNWGSQVMSMNDGNQDITYGNGTYVLATKNANNNTGATGIVYTSANANTWARVDTGNGTNNGNYRSVAYGANVFVLLGYDVPQYSSDASTWTAGAGFGNVNKVQFLNGKFIACMQGGLYYSTDGMSWTSATGASGGEFWDVAYGNGIYIAVGDAASGAYQSSTDGINWTSPTLTIDGNPSTPYLYSIAYGNNTWTMVDQNGVIYQSTNNGTTWTTVTTAASSLTSIVYSYPQNKFVTVEG